MRHRLDPARRIESAYGQAIANGFLIAAPIAVLVVLAIAFMPNITLTSKTAQRDTAATATAGAVDGIAPEAADPAPARSGEAAAVVRS